MAHRRIEIYANRQVLMRLRQGDSGREIAHSGLQKTADHRLQESGLLWDGKTCRSRWLGWGNGRSAGGVAVIVGGVNVELSAGADSHVKSRELPLPTRISRHPQGRVSIGQRLR